MPASTIVLPATTVAAQLLPVLLTLPAPVGATSISAIIEEAERHHSLRYAGLFNLIFVLSFPDGSFAACPIGADPPSWETFDDLDAFQRSLAFRAYNPVCPTIN